MFCPKCGACLANNAAFCGVCGAPIQTTNESNNPYPNVPETISNPLPMGWFKFLIYFSLFASAVLNVLNGFQMLTGSHYGGEKDLVYQVFDGLQMVDFVIGIASLAIAAFAVYTRMRLAGYHRNGPMLLSWLYIASAVVGVAYIAGLYVVVPEIVTESLDLTSTISSTVVSIAMVFVNRQYFKKRAHLFVNE